MTRLGSLFATPLVLTSLAVVPTGATAPAAERRSAPAAEPDRPLTLTRVPGSTVRSAHVPLAGLLHAGRTARLPAGSFAQVALTWTGTRPERTTYDVRLRSGDGWTDWLDLEPLADLADEPSRVRGTELLWVGQADGVQLRVSGRAPAELALVLIDPGATTAAMPVSTPSTTQTTQTPPAPPATTVPTPSIRLRATWGADESWRDGGPYYTRTIKQVHVHHTATANRYTRSDVPRMIRGMYRYHTHNLGWSDLGYNFLVDRFGRMWEGRAGGIQYPVRGAHTLGFNHVSTGIAVIGNYDNRAPSSDAVSGLVRLAAWKLSMYDRDPRATITVTSRGSDKYPEGMVVRLPIIDGHRRTNHTACPGDYLHRKLPDVRDRAHARITRFR